MTTPWICLWIPSSSIPHDNSKRCLSIYRRLELSPFSFCIQPSLEPRRAIFGRLTKCVNLPPQSWVVSHSHTQWVLCNTLTANVWDPQTHYRWLCDGTEYKKITRNLTIPQLMVCKHSQNRPCLWYKFVAFWSVSTRLLYCWPICLDSKQSFKGNGV